MTIKTLSSPNFYLLILILGAGIALRQTPERNLEHRPTAIQLAKPLSDLPKTFGNFAFIQEIQLLESVERKLRADEQITWIYQDQSQAKDAPGSAIRLHIAFYTGYEQTIRVRHVPEVCYVNFGYEAIDSHRGTIEIANEDIDIPIQVFRFGAQDSADEYATAYCFVANGRYCAAADEVRIACSNPDSPTTYFVKIELLPGVMNRDSDGNSIFAPTPSTNKEILQKSQDFLSTFMPQLQLCLP